MIHRYAALFVISFFIVESASARELTPGQYAQVPPEIRDWFQNQKSPKTGVPCCSEADGELVEEELRGGTYWIRSNLTLVPYAATEGWVEVPDDVVINGPNNYGQPVAWWQWGEDPEWDPPTIHCYAPGAKT